MCAGATGAFRFLHVFTARVGEVGALGPYTVDSTAQEVAATRTPARLFDGTVRTDGDDPPRLRLSGQGA